MRLISFGEININIVFLLIGVVAKLIAEFVLILGNNFNFNLYDYPFILGLNSAFGMSLAIIPYFYINNSYRKRENKLSKNKYFEKYLKKTEPFVKYKKYLILFLFFNNFFFFLYSNDSLYYFPSILFS